MLLCTSEQCQTDACVIGEDTVITADKHVYGIVAAEIKDDMCDRLCNDLNHLITNREYRRMSRLLQLLEKPLERVTVTTYKNG